MSLRGEKPLENEDDRAERGSKSVVMTELELFDPAVPEIGASVLYRAYIANISFFFFFPVGFSEFCN